MGAPAWSGFDHAYFGIEIGAVVVWAVRQARKAKGVAGILSGVETADDRKAALEKIEQKQTEGV